MKEELYRNLSVIEIVNWSISLATFISIWFCCQVIQIRLSFAGEADRNFAFYRKLETYLKGNKIPDYENMLNILVVNSYDLIFLDRTHLKEILTSLNSLHTRVLELAGGDLDSDQAASILHKMFSIDHLNSTRSSVTQKLTKGRLHSKIIQEELDSLAREIEEMYTKIITRFMIGKGETLSDSFFQANSLPKSLKDKSDSAGN